MNVLQMHAKNIKRWNGDEFWQPSDFVWEVEERLYFIVFYSRSLIGLYSQPMKRHKKDWTADHLTTNVDRTKHPNVYTVLDEINVLSEKDMRKIAYWPKILNARNPFTRLYSAWNDKATSYPMHYNGSITYNGIDLMSRFRNKTEFQ